MDSASWLQYGEKMDPELEAMLSKMPEQKRFADYEDVPSLRASIDEQVKQGLEHGIFQKADLKGVNKKEIQIPTRDGESIGALVYRSENKKDCPLLVYFHGGGFTFAHADTWEVQTATLVKELGFVVVSVEYRLAPEKLFPTAAHDAWDALKWAAENAEQLGVDPCKGFIVGGTSAGANIAAVASHEAADATLFPPLTGVYLADPCLVHLDAVPEKYKEHNRSPEQCKDAPILSRRDMDWFHKQYNTDPKSHLGSPLNWPSGHMTQPPTFFQLCGMDIHRDTVMIYEYHLQHECNIPTRLSLYPGFPHGGPDFLPMLSQSKEAAADMKSGFEWLLSMVRKV